MDTIRLLLVDDHRLFVESLKTVIHTRTKDIKVVAIAGSGMEAIECVERERPHIVLMDVRMPNMDGVEATWILRQKHPDVQIVMLTTFDDDAFVHEALYHGAVGYLLKDIPPDELIAAVRAVREGAVLISPTVAAKLVQQAYGAGSKNDSLRRRGQAAPRWLSTLSNKEKQVLSLLSQGLDNKEIAKRLFIAEQTVKNHVSVVYSKIGARDRAKAMRMAMEARLDATSRRRVEGPAEASERRRGPDSTGSEETR